MQFCLMCLRQFSKMASGDFKAEEFRTVHFPKEMKAKSICYTSKSPVGVCTIITPWNYPLYMVIIKLAPCIVYGNTCVIKPSEFTSSTAFHFAKLLDKINLPKGVVNFLFGLGKDVGPFICKDPRVKAVAFTGSTATGSIIAQNAAISLKKVTLECGGKNPAIVFDDCNFQKAVETIAASAFTNNGEICLCMERVYVQESIFEKFLEKLVEHVKKDWKLGMPDKPDTKIGPLSSRTHYEKVTKMVARAVENDGAKVELGYLHENDQTKQNFESLGHFFPPTILTNCPKNSEIMQKEVFGPITCLTPFKTEQEAIKLANDTTYGLGALVITENLSKAHRVAPKIKAGTVWVNDFLCVHPMMPFGGHKMSGVGREGGYNSEEFFTENSNVCVRVDL